MPRKAIVYAWIFARGGSKGLPGKNLRSFGGKPLIAHAIELGLQSRFIDRVFVSTDSHEIADVAMHYGAEVPFLRPAVLSSDDAPERLAWRHAIEWVRASDYHDMDVMVSLPATAPLRTVGEVEQAIQYFSEGWDTVISVSPSGRHPSFNMVNINEEGEVSLASPLNEIKCRRQDLPLIYNISTAFYVTSPDFVMRTDSFWEGRVGAVEIPLEHAVDIDTKIDFDFAEFLLNRRNGTDEDA